ncbi:MAG: hypothetical protein ACKO40_09895 [Planctomycetaceae bacterium]
MSLIRVGSTSKYAEGWDSIFGRRKGTKATSSATKPAKAVKSAPKAAKKKASRVAKKKAVTKASKPGKSRRG